MDIVEVINKRRSTRAFKPETPPKKVLEEIIELALRAPSWANTQPWEFVIVMGKELEEIRQEFVKRAATDPYPDVARPQVFPEPYDSRRRAMGARMFEIKGIKREDKEKRSQWTSLGLKLFEAPAVIYICIDRAFYFQGNSINVWSVFDCGLVAENVMLLATNYGLGTIPQIQAVNFPDVVKKKLGIPDSKLLLIGIAIGYPDLNDPINKFRSERESLVKVTKWHGYD